MDPASETKWKQDLCEVGRRIWLREYVASNDGNFSLRISENEVLTTPTGVSKGFLTPDMICKVDMEGRKLEGACQPSSEVHTHLAIYRRRPDVRAVVHAHPPTATGFAVAGLSLDVSVLPEAVVGLGGVPLCPYALPGSPEVPEALKQHLGQYDAFLLANHGAITIGPDLWTAYHRMEVLEHSARVLLTAKLLGSARGLPEHRVQELYAVRERLGLAHSPDPPARAPSAPTCMGDDCPVCGVDESGSACGCGGPARDLVERITAEVLRVLKG